MRNQTMKPKTQLLPLTGLRFFLALWVVIYHQTATENYLGPLMSRLPGSVFCVLRTGYVAVGFFFVLSGFVLSYSHSLATRFSSSQLVSYAVARFARIYPTYCFGLLLIAPFIAVDLLGRWSAATATKEVAKAILNWTLLQSWVPRAAFSWNAPGWSLSDEAFFYCCFPLVGIALWKLSRLRSILLVALVIWAAALVAPLIAFIAPLRPFGIAAAIWRRGTLIHSGLILLVAILCYVSLSSVSEYWFAASTMSSSRNSYLMGKGYWLYLPGVVLEGLALGNSNVMPLPFVQNGLLLPLHSLVILGFALGGGSSAGCFPLHR